MRFIVCLSSCRLEKKRSSMGGCCSSAKGPELTVPDGYNHRLRTPAHQVPLPAYHGTIIVPSPGLLVDINLGASIPDTYRSPPAPVPYDVVLGYPQTSGDPNKATGDKSGTVCRPTNFGFTEEIAAGDKTQDNSVKFDDLKMSGCKKQSDFGIENEDQLESNPPKPAELEECPTCLEEYDAGNPKIITKCEHHFHLACILEWLERSDTCPVCDQEMVFDPLIS
ncbi:hypothetical protein SAY86_021454 [Trapa natans]|uniref:RING-type E3 ubiquitin transferase n=1 Tax=Trapa natans TaxID=22666 RepID=A0AAN7M9Z6_TRANT|nr:hypothetical protein SAY86_021454 [Trapa natans]